MTQGVTLHPIDSQSPDDLHAFRDERGFFRARTEHRPDPLADFEIEAGPPLSPEDARREVRRFLDALADGRPILEQHDDPLEFAQRNGLLLLIGPEEERKLAAIGRRMPRDMAVAWRDALRGGSASDAFGPLSEPERLDERRVEAELRSGDSHRRRSLLIGGAALLVVLAVVGVLLVRRGGDDDAAGSISFAPADDADEQGDLREGPPPSVVPALVARLDRAVAVAPGDGPVADRVVLDPPADDLPVPLGAVAATLMRYNGSGQVVLVGPDGWLANACIQVSPIAESLRPFEMAFHETAPGACPGWVYGREATVSCASDTTVMLDLRIPEGEVGLEEGGTASLSAVRALVLGNADGYEQLSVNGQISVATGSDVTVPAMGGAVGETVNFDVTAPSDTPQIGSCVIQ